MIVYEDKFAFSHHGTDPCGSILCNSFDLVRIHMFGHLDTNSHAEKSSKSYTAMVEFAREDKEVKKIIATENITDSKYDFATDREETEEGEETEPKEINIDWMSEL